MTRKEAISIVLDHLTSEEDAGMLIDCPEVLAAVHKLRDQNITQFNDQQRGQTND